MLFLGTIGMVRLRSTRQEYPENRAGRKRRERLQTPVKPRGSYLMKINNKCFNCKNGILFFAIYRGIDSVYYNGVSSTPEGEFQCPTSVRSFP
jgi:hypothetical protein